ncbi:ATP-binding protein [Sporosarcina sp.]|uniref:two-component system sensor histidine kinase NtrB n=1 Tax=Sporosarcina sp. TaxID=49982 RepID=UPI002605E76A|nr:ATP-binding protein [Sporosarcina sp.]
MLGQHFNEPRYYNYFDLFFKQSQDAISVFDLENRVITGNPAFEKLYGWSLEECVGEKIQFYPDSEIEKVEQRCELLKQGMSLANERVTEQRKDGSIFQAEISMTPIFNDQDEVMAFSYVTRDITSRLQLEQNKLEIERLQTMSMIAAVVAHEVRNPMTAITGFIQMMNQDSTNPYTSFTQVMEMEIKRVNQIVSDFLILSKPTLHNPSYFSITDTLKTAIEEFQEDFELRNIVLSSTFPEQELTFYGNQSSLKQVLYNVLTNSYDAIEQNGSICLSLNLREDTFSIRIQDDGEGMDNDTLEKLYMPFFSTKAEGTGLGMIISKKIIVDHKGTLEVDSLQSVGTTVTITLPLTDNPLH